MHELFEHTADLGLRARADTPDALFAEMAACLFAAIVDDVAAVAPAVEHRFEVAGDGDAAFLLFDWLNALLYRHDSEKLLFGRFDMTVSPDFAGLTASAWGEPMDAARHPLAREVKAITYHDLRVEREGDGWLAEAIVDI